MILSAEKAQMNIFLKVLSCAIENCKILAEKVVKFRIFDKFSTKNFRKLNESNLEKICGRNKHHTQ